MSENLGELDGKLNGDEDSQRRRQHTDALFARGQRE